MSIIEVKSENGLDSRKFVNVDKLIEALTEHRIPFDPVIENVDFSGKDFNRSEEDSNAADERVSKALFAAMELKGSGLSNEEIIKKYEEMSKPAESDNVKATFKNCNFDKANIFCPMDIKAEGCSFKGTYLEASSFTLKGKNNDCEGLHGNEARISLDVSDCSFKDFDFWKTHVSGKLKNCNFASEKWSRTYLGQHNDLVMDNVDFGDKEIDECYFESKNLKLINPKMNSETLNKISQMNPEALKTGDGLGNNLSNPAYGR